MKAFSAQIFRALSLVLFFVLLIPARAGVLTLDWIGAGNNPVGGYYVSPYTAEIRNTGDFITLYCIDFNHEVAPPLEWQAVIQPLTWSNVGSLQYGNWSSNVNNTWINYEAAAWLITQLTQSNSLYQQGVDQYAAWKIFLDPAHAGAFDYWVNALGSSFAADVNAAYTNAFTAVQNGYSPTGWDVVSPDPAGLPDSTQEFLTPAEAQLTPLATPEPGSILLLGTILLAGASLGRWRLGRKRTGPR